MKLSSLMVGIVMMAGCFSVASATPTLGVATDQYAYTDPNALYDQYIRYFADDNIVPATDDAYHGFVIGASGSQLTIFTSYKPWETPIYLMSNTGTDNAPISFNNNALTFQGAMCKIIGGYNNPARIYYQLMLPTAESYWSTCVFEQSKTFYLLSGAISYAGSITAGDYFFAIADSNHNGRADVKDDFSPKTTSAGGIPGTVPVPEPATWALMISGCAGIFLKRFKKS